MHESDSPADVARWLERLSAEKWPAIPGSLSLRRSPCVRENCRACQSGEQHLSYVLYGRIGERGLSIYIPEYLLPRAIATSSSPRTVERHLKAHNLVGYFQAIVGNGDYERGKPEPDPFLKA